MTTKLAKFTDLSQWHPFVRGLAAFGSAEAFARLVRLGAIIVIARQISAEMLGTAAMALSIFEIVRVLSNVGVGQRIVVATKAEVEAISLTAHRLFMMVCASVASIQLCVAAVMWTILDLQEAASMVALLSLVYLFMPSGLVRIFRAMRAQRMGAVAKVAAVQNGLDCLLTLALVVFWPSAWAIVLPKLLTAPVWLLLARRTFDWHPDKSVRPAPYSHFRQFGPAILITEMTSAARQHGDKLIIGAMLGTEALGLYYFAFNAGLGITLSFVSACNTVLLPHLAAQSAVGREIEFRRSFWFGLAILLPLIACQALLAPLYVPAIFGAKWAPAIPLLAALTAAALPLYAGALIGARYRAMGQPFSETSLSALASCAALVGLAIGASISPIWASAGFTIGLALVFLTTALLHFSTNPIQTYSKQKEVPHV